MIRDEVGARLRDRHERDGYLFPAYDDYCFANVPHTVASLLGADAGPTLPGDALRPVDADVETVLVVLVDGLGLAQWRRDHADHPFLRRLTERGRVTPLTSIYPSETAAAITTVHTGALPAAHGVIGWNVYEPTIDQSFEALPFRTKDGDPPAMDPDDVAAAEPLYPALREAGIDARHVVPFEETPAGARLHAYDKGDLDTFVEGVLDALDAADPPAYVYAYLPHIDAVSHESGTDSDAYRDTLAAIDDRLGTIADAACGRAGDTLLVVTADHGHVDTDPDRNVDLAGFDVVRDNLRTHADGTPIRFAGSPRNVHLHLRPDAVEDVRAALVDALDARVFRRDDVLERGLFGPDPSPTFRRRLGDLVVSHRDLSVWYGGDAEPGELELVGMHGGLNPDEMLVPFAAMSLDDEP